jgi:membrane protein required for beta-lactamase induction
MAFVILLIIAIALLRFLIPIVWGFLLAVWIVLCCTVWSIRNEIDERRAAKAWREAQRADK